MKKFKTINYFSQRNFAAININLNKKKFIMADFPKEDFIHDLNLYTENELKEFYYLYEQKFDLLTEGYSKKEKEMELRKWKINEDMSKQISKERINALINTNKPYDNKDFEDIPIENGLVKIDQFTIGINSFILNDNEYQLCIPNNESNSNYWISEAIIKFSKNKNVTFQVRLDPLIKNPIKIVLFMDIYGAKLNWDQLSNINSQISILKESNGIKTEIVWTKKENELHFKCEELPLYKSVQERGSRYFHAIYNIENKIITHCDGSIKVYNTEDFLKRNNVHLKDKNTKKLGKYIKIFRGDGEISTDNFTSLITSYFIRNNDVVNYLKELNDKLNN